MPSFQKSHSLSLALSFLCYFHVVLTEPLKDSYIGAPRNLVLFLLKMLGSKQTLTIFVISKTKVTPSEDSSKQGVVV